MKVLVSSFFRMVGKVLATTALAGTSTLGSARAQEVPPPKITVPPLHTNFQTPGPWFLVPYRIPAVKPSPSGNSDRVSQLLSGNVLFLSLQDAIDLAVENNFDVDIQRFDREYALTDVMRSEGGGLLRGISTSVAELPAGVGGPAEPLLTTAGGYSPVIQLPSSAGNLVTTTETSADLSIISSSSLSNGPSTPQFDPTVAAGASVAQQILPVASPLITGSNIQETHDVLFNVGYQQGFSPGTQINVSDNGDWTTSSSMNNNLNPYTGGYVSVSIVQPLLQGFGVRVNRRFIRIAKNNGQVADYVFEQQLINTVSDVIRLYWDFVSLTSDLEVKRSSLEAAQRLYEDTSHYVEQGTQAPLQLTSARAQLESSKQDYINSQGLVLQQELLLKELLTRTGIGDPRMAAAKILAVTKIEIPTADGTGALATLLDEAMRNRPDLQVADLQLQNTRIQIEGTRNALLPQLDVLATMQNSGLAGEKNPATKAGTPPPPPGLIGGYGTVQQQVFNRAYPSYSVGVQLNLPLRNRVARADAIRDDLQLRQAQVKFDQLESQVRLQVGNAQIAVQQAIAGYQSASEARKLQEQAVDVEQARFDEGVDTAYDLIQFQRDLSQAKSSEVAALGVYAKAKAALERAVGLTLINNQVNIDQAYQGQVDRAPSPAPSNPHP